MKKAAESAAKWLADKVRGNPKLNPIPFPFFKSIVSKQVEWARTQRNVNLKFDELSDAVRSELLKAGIHVMSESRKENKPEREDWRNSDSTEKGTEHEILPPLHLSLNPLTLNAGALEPMHKLFKWFALVLEKAAIEKCSCLKISVHSEEEDCHA